MFARVSSVKTFPEAIPENKGHLCPCSQSPSGELQNRNHGDERISVFSFRETQKSVSRKLYREEGGHCLNGRGVALPDDGHSCSPLLVSFLEDALCKFLRAQRGGGCCPKPLGEGGHQPCGALKSESNTELLMQG